MCETIKSKPTKITPSISELCMVNNSLSCPECSATFSSSSNLDLHLVKRHKLGSLPKPIASVQYHCPVAGCIYESQRHFAKRKYVKQHYLKVHAAKSFACNGCKCSYSTAAALKKHMSVCGRQFQCPCGLSFNSLEALANHKRRLGHRKFGFCSDDPAKGVRSLPPAPVILAAVALSELSFRSRRDNAAQTEADRGVPMSAQTESPWQRGAATQTARRISATTQTPPRRPIKPKHEERGGGAKTTQSSRSPPASRKRKSAQTQTNSPNKRRRQDPANQSQATPLAEPAHEVDALFSEGAELLDALWAGQLDCQTQTEPEPSLLDQLLDCETQTEGEVDSLDGSYCNSTTQTCDHFLFPELGCCHDMHTQTDV